MIIKSFALCDLREDSRASLRNSVALRTIDDDWKALGSSRVPRKPRGLRGVRPKRMRLLRDPAKSRPAAARKRTGEEPKLQVRCHAPVHSIRSSQ